MHWNNARTYRHPAETMHLPAPTDDVVIFVCGPPGMYESLCGPRNEPQELKGILAEMGYAAAQVVKF